MAQFSELRRMTTTTKSSRIVAKPARGIVSKALSHARAKRSQAREPLSHVYDCELRRDEHGFGLSVEVRAFHGDHLGTLSSAGFSHLVVGIEPGGPAERRGLRMLDRVLEIEEQPLDDGEISTLVEGKHSVLFTIERFEGEALAGLAWHMAIAACAYDDIGMLKECCATLAEGGLDARKLRVRRVDAVEFRTAAHAEGEDIALLPGSSLLHVATASGNAEIVDWLLRDGEASDGSAEDETEESSTQEYGTPRSQLSSGSTPASTPRSSAGSTPVLRSPREHLLRPPLSSAPAGAPAAAALVDAAPGVGLSLQHDCEEEGEESYDTPRSRPSPRRQAELLSNTSDSSSGRPNNLPFPATPSAESMGRHKFGEPPRLPAESIML